MDRVSHTGYLPAHMDVATVLTVGHVMPANLDLALETEAQRLGLELETVVCAHGKNFRECPPLCHGAATASSDVHTETRRMQTITPLPSA